jgi:hypothetical protein
VTDCLRLMTPLNVAWTMYLLEEVTVPLACWSDVTRTTLNASARTDTATMERGMNASRGLFRAAFA